MFNSAIYSRQFVTLISANMFFWMSVNFFLPVLPIYYHSLGMDDHQIGLAIGAFFVGSVLFRVFAGRAVDHYGGKPVLTIGMVLSVISIIGYYYSQTLLPAMLTRFLHGAGISGYASAALTMVTLMHEEHHTTEAVAAYTLFTMFGVGVASSSAIWIFGLGDFSLIVICGVVTTLLSLLLFPRKPKLKVKISVAETLPLRTVACHPGVIIPAVSLLATSICFGSMMTFLPLMMISQGIKGLGMFYIAYSVTVILSRFWVSRLCNWLTAERLSLYILLMLGATMLLAGQIVAEWVLVLSGVSIGISSGLVYPALASVVTANTQPVNRGTAFGFFTMAFDIGVAGGAIVLGAVASVWGYQAVFLAAGAYTLAYAAAYYWWLMGRLLSCQTE
ncbi:MAG: MFS transporter [Negativicutes bacterium]|nr:MFS transporter [Negativicutes bacterium]